MTCIDVQLSWNKQICDLLHQCNATVSVRCYDELHIYLAILREAISKNIERNKINYLIRNPLKLSHNPQEDKRVRGE